MPGDGNMLGAIIGDLCGSTREFAPIKTKSFDLAPPGSNLTDDSVLTIAVGEAILDGTDFGPALRHHAREYPTSYGHSFYVWALGDDPAPYGSWGNGSAMRVAACAWLADDLGQALDMARRSAEATHDHPEGVRGAVAVVLAIYLARCGWDAARIRAEVATTSRYRLSMTVDGIRPGYKFDVSCLGSVPEALVCALESTSYEDAVRNAVSLGGDADTQAAIAGAVAEPLHGRIPPVLVDAAWERLRAWRLDETTRRLLASTRPPTDPTTAMLDAARFTDTPEAWRIRRGDPGPEVEVPRKWDRERFLNAPAWIEPEPLGRELWRRFSRRFRRAA